jgi:hypothetical protein
LCYLFFDGKNMAFSCKDVFLAHSIDRVVRVEQQVQVLTRLREEERFLNQTVQFIYFY